jgi:CXXX repeat modification system protein
MYREKVGFVNEDEKKEMMRIYERGIALKELLPELSNPLSDFEQKEKDIMYERIIKDTAETKLKLEAFWQELAQKYKWTGNENGYWQIDFETDEIYLVTP